MEHTNTPADPAGNNPYSLKNSESNLEWIIALLILPIVGILVSTIYIQLNPSHGQVSGVSNMQMRK